MSMESYSATDYLASQLRDAELRAQQHLGSIERRLAAARVYLSTSNDLTQYGATGTLSADTAMLQHELSRVAALRLAVLLIEEGVQ